MNQIDWAGYPKIKPIRSPRYLKFIRSHSCIECGSTNNIQASHQNIYEGVMGSKVSDFQSLPRCYQCHRENDQMDDKLFAAISIIKFINKFFSLGYNI